MKLPLPRVIDGSGATLFSPVDVAALDRAYSLALARIAAAETALSRHLHLTFAGACYGVECETWRAAVAAHLEADPDA